MKGVLIHSSKWSHLSDIPSDIRETILKTSEPLDNEDEEIIKSVTRSLRCARLTHRVRVLVPALHTARPGLSMRAVFRAISLHVGLSYERVREIYYERGTNVESAG